MNSIASAADPTSVDSGLYGSGDTASDGDIDFTSPFVEVEEEITVRYGPSLSEEDDECTSSSDEEEDSTEIDEDIHGVEPESPYAVPGMCSEWNPSTDLGPVQSRETSSSSAAPVAPKVFDQPPCYSAETSLFTDIDVSKVNIRMSGIIGQGRFGRVLLAMREDNGEMLAVKEVSLRELGDDPQKKVQNLICEIQIMRPLRHPNIVRYFGTTMSNHMLNIIMEFVPGGSLASIISKFGSLPENLVRKYAQQIVQGLEYLHGQQIVHRDIKGANILIDHKGLLKLADFGCSRQIMDLMRASQYTLTGTPHWMAPEVIRQTGHGTPADIWSLGCTIIEMATGQPPFIHLGTNYAVMYAIASTEEEMELPSGLSPTAHAFLRCCLDRDASKRWSATQLMDHPWFAPLRNPLPADTPSPPITIVNAPPMVVSDKAVPSTPVEAPETIPLNCPDEAPAAPGESIPPGKLRRSRPKPAQLGEIGEVIFQSPEESPCKGGQTPQSNGMDTTVTSEHALGETAWAQRHRLAPPTDAPLSTSDAKTQMRRETQSATTRNRRFIAEQRKATSAPIKAPRRHLLKQETVSPSVLTPITTMPSSDSNEVSSPNNRFRQLNHTKQIIQRPKDRRPGGAITPNPPKPPCAQPSSVGGKALPVLDGKTGIPTSSTAPGFVPLFNSPASTGASMNPPTVLVNSPVPSSPSKRVVERRISFKKGNMAPAPLQPHLMHKFESDEPSSKHEVSTAVPAASPCTPDVGCATFNTSHIDPGIIHVGSFRSRGNSPLSPPAKNPPISAPRPVAKK